MYMYKKALYTCLQYTGTGAISHQQEIDFEPKKNYIYTSSPNNAYEIHV